MPKLLLHQPAALAAPAQANGRSAGQQQGTKAASVTSKGRAGSGRATAAYVPVHKFWLRNWVKKEGNLGLP